ncbi:universal stress protein UspF [Yersinia canariae]|uniref:Universal stress protein n=1 Tax=Yersinia canariae TaxID=2607663 RepID=A0A857F060_9GAMM|nr:universal stress protein UspF [Yersinia canariae]QHB32415.1 universal stress protein UspF [Yersinia canariae]
MYHSILVPIDISDPEFTQQLISHVETQANITDVAHVHFLTVIPAFPYYASLGLAYSGEAPSQEQIKNEALSKFSEIIDKFDIPEERIKKHIVSGSPKDEILRLADSIRADLIVIASHRPDIMTYLLGSTAAAVVRHAKCSVLVVR